MSAAVPGVLDTAAEVRAGRRSAVDVVRSALLRVRTRNDAINAFTAVTEERALAAAQAVDDAGRAGRDPGPLAGVPFAVKNLFDVKGITTLAGSRIDAARPPAAQDATLVARLEAAGAILIGALNMDEYAFGFSTQNTHYGATRNPHDTTRRKTFLYELQRLVIPVAAEGRYDHGLVGDIEICIRRGQTLILIDHRPGHRQLYDVELFPIEQPHGRKLG